MLMNLVRRAASALSIPAPRWLSDYATRDLDREIGELRTELENEKARSQPRPDHIAEIEKGLTELTQLRARFP